VIAKYKSNRNSFLNYLFLCSTFLLVATQFSKAQSFDQSNLQFNGNGDIGAVTSMSFGPDGRLYVVEYTGAIKILTIERINSTTYTVTDNEVLNGILNIQDHNDDGTDFENNNNSFRETIGIVVSGTAETPVFYVSSSDYRIGAGSGGGNGDVGLDTNSGIITRFSWNGTAWDAVDIVRGLPRSEENHATNGLQLATINGINYLVVAQGGHTNGGSPSINFVLTCEYALSGAVLAIDLDMLDTMVISNDNGRSYIYDIPTLDDPTRPNVNGIIDPDIIGYDGVDINDPFGGNDGLNMAMVVPNGPVKILSPGYRNAYDLVVTESGALYVTDNGANQGWGGFPDKEGESSVTNEFILQQPGNSGEADDGEYINNVDHLQLVTTNLGTYDFNNSFYGGHPNPIRANPQGAGLYTDNESDLGTFGSPTWRTDIYHPTSTAPGFTDNPDKGLPANWPPVQVANAVEGDWRGPGISNNPAEGPDDNPVVVWDTNTNAIDEYTATNFEGALQGNLLAGHSDGNIRRVILSADGASGTLDSNFFSGIGGNVLGLTCNSDTDIFPGTVWAGTFGGEDSKIVVYEPVDFLSCIAPGEQNYDATADYDEDGYTNQDEEDNETGPCNGGSQPTDFDKLVGGTLISDINDTDDDSDGIIDAEDPFQLGNPFTIGSDAFSIPVANDLFNNQQGLGGIFGLGMTGLMNNGDTGLNWLSWIDDRGNGPNPDDVLGGAPGIMTSHMTSGTALGSANSQEKGYQYGVEVDVTTAPFSVIGGMNGFSEGSLRLYGNSAAIGGELGFFIGDGTQSNYIKFVVTTDGFTVLQEIEDIAQTPIVVTLLTADRPSSNIRFYFVVNPQTGNVSLDYQIDSNSRVNLASIFAQGKVLEALQQSSLDLAVGFIGTSGVDGVELEGSWDFINVLGAQPLVTATLPDMDRLVGSVPESINLYDYFNDDGGPEALTFSIAANTATSISAVVNTNILDLSFPAAPAISTITIRATDAENNFVEQIFTVNVTDEPIVLYRINTGGIEITSIDGDMNWSADTADANSEFLTEAGTSSHYNPTNINATTNAVNTNKVPLSIFNSERSDTSVGVPNVTYSFPVTENGNYEVRLYMMNGWSGTDGTGERIFSATIEGDFYPELTDIDLSGTFGHQVGTMISHIVQVTDGVIDISLLHGEEQNPLINGIEILDSPTLGIPINVYSIDDQLSFAGDALDGSLGVQTQGGDGNLVFSATGLPPGVSIEPTNGQIGGNIDAGAEVNSPYEVTITVDDSDAISTDAVTLQFTWTINEISRFRFRLNAAGSLVSSTDGEIDWVANNGSGFLSAAGYTVNTGNTATGSLTYADRDVSIPSYIDETTYNAIFNTERWDSNSGAEMQFDIPLPNGDYMVNLYMGNYSTGTNSIGERIFDISLEGTLLVDNLDLIAQFGHLKGGMISLPVTLVDGEINILFEHVVENPLINAIEITSLEGNQPPNAVASATPLIGDPPLEVTFIGSLSTDDLSVATYLWDFGDGNTDNIADPVHIYLTQGSYNATLTVTDAEGLQDAQQLTIAVGNQAPIAIASATPIAGPAPLDVNFSGSGSTDDNTIVSYSWDFGNGDSSTNEDPSYQFTEVGIYTVTLTVDDGEITDTETIVIDVTCPWNDLADSNLEKMEAQSAKVGDKLYVFAGFLSNLIITPATEVYDTTTDLWTTVAPMPIPVTHMGIAVVGTDIWIISGFAGNHPGTPENAVQIYNTISNSWSSGPPLPAPNGSGAAAFNNGKIHYFGGLLPDRNTDVGDHFVLDVNNQGLGWLTAAPLLNPRNHLSAASVNGLVYAIGGQHAHDILNEVQDQNNLDVYDPATDAWTSLANLPSARSHFEPGTTVHNGKIIIVGGRQGELFFFDNITEYNPITNAWTDGCKLPEPLLAPAAKAFGDRLIVANGGVNGTGSASNTTRSFSIEPEFSSLSLNLVADQSNQVGDSSTLAVVANGGDPNENITYTISDQPAGIDIDPNNGQITGTIDTLASNGGQNNSGIHLVTVTASRPYSEDATQQFIWSIGLIYNGTAWFPYAPDATTASENAYISSGEYIVISDLEVNNLTVQSGADLIVSAGSAITTNGDINVNENGFIELRSTSTSYASLIANGTVNGNVIYKRHVNSTAAQGLSGSNDLITPPVSGQAFNDFVTNNGNIVSNTGNTLYLFGPFNKTNGSYDIYGVAETAILDAGTGYRAGSTDNSTFTFTGTVNTNPITLSISNSGPAFQEWNLIGNPYPSYLNLGAFLSTNNAAFGSNSAAIYGYDGDASNGWVVWNQAYADFNPEHLIAPGQGFFVASEAAAGTVNFLPSMREKGTSDDFIAGRSASSLPGFLKLSLDQSGKTAQTDFYFSPNASRGLDKGYDAQTWGGNPSNFSLHSYLVEEDTGLPMVIQSLGEIDYADIQIPLGINANVGEQISISISENTLPSTIEVYLEDQLTQTVVLLNNSDYVLTPSNPLNTNGRFFLRFTDTALSLDTLILNKLNVFSDSRNQSIVISGLITEHSTAKLYDVQGRQVLSSALRLNTSTQNIKVNGINKGVYIISIESASEKITKKLIIR
jgi:PKD repeat protein